MSNFLSSAGLALEGAQDYRGSENRLAGQEAELAAAKQRAQLTNQQIETGQLGLEDLRRNKAQDRVTQDVGATSIKAGNTMSGSLLDMANAEASAGRMQQALQYRQAQQQLEAMGGPAIVHATVTGNPGERPDIAAIMNQYDATKGVTKVVQDSAGNLQVERNGQVGPVDVKKMGELLGIFKPPKLETIPAGGVGVMTGPGINPADKANQITTQKTFAENPQHGYEKVKNADGEESLIDIRPTVDGKPNPSYGKQVTGGAGTTPGGANVRKDLHVLNEVTKAVADLGPEYAAVDMTGLTPKVTMTKKGNQVAMVAEQLRMANQNMPPRTIVDIAANGKAVPKYVDGKFAGNVALYNGQEFAMQTPQGTPQAKPAAPAAPSVPSPTATVSAPAPAPALQPVGGTPAIEPQDNTRSFQNPFSTGGVKEVPGARAEFDKRMAVEKARTTFRQIVGGDPKKLYSQGDIAALQKIMAAGVLTQAETAQAKTLLKNSGVEGYAKGGKVSRHGLG
jgi:hypothetical protein